MKNMWGSLTMPCLIRSERPRTSVISIARASRRPTASDVIRKPSPANGSGMKPVLSSWNSSGNGPTDEPRKTASASPLKTSMPARVTINDGIL